MSDVEEYSIGETGEVSKGGPGGSLRNDPEEFSTTDSGGFSWQQKGHDVPCEPECEDYLQEESMYADDNVKTTGTDAESDSDYACNECHEPVTGGRFTCVQCADYDLCARCAGERAAHRHHYLLRVPPRRPPDEVQRVLQTLRSMLYKDSDTDTGDEDEVEVKTEVNDEFEDKFDPLSVKVEEQPADEHLTLKRTMPIISTETQHTPKRTRQESGIVSDAMTEPVGGSTGDVHTDVLSNVKCEQDEPPATLIGETAMANSLTRLAATAAVVTDTISPIQAPTLAAPQSTRTPAHTRAPVAISSINLNRQIALKEIIGTPSSKNQPRPQKYIMLPRSTMGSQIVHKKGRTIPVVDETRGRVALVSGSSQPVPAVVHGSVKNPGHTQKQDEVPSASVTGKSSVSSVQKQRFLKDVQIQLVRNKKL